MAVNNKYRLTICVFVVSLISALALCFSCSSSKPLSEPQLPKVPNAGMSQAEREHFLNGDFRIVKSVSSLPEAVVRALTEQGTMADPGKKFIAGDVIYDSSLPRRRLIFGGVADDKCFLHYERGGRTHDFILELLRVNGDKTEPLWKGHCGPAANLEDLRAQVGNGSCL